MAFNDNLIIDEEGITEYCHTLQRYASSIDKKIYKYLQILKKLNNDGIISGETAIALQEFYALASVIWHQPSFIASQAYSMQTQFLDQVDEHDSYFY